jgi:hypothetical protein
MKRFTLLAGTARHPAGCMLIMNDRRPDAPRHLSGNRVGGRFENEVFHMIAMISEWADRIPNPAAAQPCGQRSNWRGRD